MRNCLGLGVALAVMAALPAQAQVSLDPLTSTLPSRPSTPTPAQPMVRPGQPGPGQPLGVQRQVPQAQATVPARTVRVDQRQANPNGLVMTVDSISYMANGIVVTARVLNTTGRAMWLNAGGGLTLADDKGRTYPFVPPADNPEVQIAPQSQVTANLVFAGGVAMGSRGLQLWTNGRNGSHGDRLTPAPQLVFRLPPS